MKDTIIAGTGNSQYLKTALPAGTTWDDALSMLRAGTFPIDLNGINAAGFTQIGTVLNTQNLFADTTATALGLDTTAVPDDALNALITLLEAKVNAEQAAAAAPVQSVAGKTGDVDLDAGDVAYDDEDTYADGTVGAELAETTSEADTALAYALAAFPADTASGAVASFPDGADGVPVKSMTVAIEPVQSGTGTPAPDNIRPISGWTKAQIQQTGKNLWGGLTMAKAFEGAHIYSIDTENKTFTFDRINPSKVLFTPPVSQGTIIVTYSNAGRNNCIRVMYTDGSSLAVELPDSGGAKTTVAIASASFKTIANISLGYFSATTTTIWYDESGFFEGTVTAAAFAPYIGTTYEVDWTDEAGTVYGGVLDVTTGVLTVNRAYYKGGWSQYNSNNGYIAYRKADTALCPGINKLTSGGICNVLDEWGAFSSANMDRNIIQPRGQAGVQWAYMALQDDVDPSTVEYSTLLAEPFTVQLSPKEISTLLGQNNIWADAGDVTVEYRADTGLYIQKLTGATEDDMTANANIASGTYFMVGNTLYLSTAAIAQGATIAPGTNCTLTNLAEALNALNT